MKSLSILKFPVRDLNQKERVVVLVTNVILAWFIYFIATGEATPSGNGASIWFLAATSYWFLNLLGTPFFTPPKDSFSTSIAVILLLLPVSFPETANYILTLTILKGLGIVLAVLVATMAIVAIVKKEQAVGMICYQLSRHLGRGEVLFTIVVTVIALGFYQENLAWMYYTMVFWTVMLSVKPIELGYKTYLFIKEYLNGAPLQSSLRVGSIHRIDDPKIIRVILTKIDSWDTTKLYLARLPNGSNYHVLPLFTQTQQEEVIGTGLLCDDPIIDSTVVSVGVYELLTHDPLLVNRVISQLSGDETPKQVAGIVVEGSVIESVRFQTARNLQIEKGMVVYTLIQGKKVYYQILDASTHEEGFMQNPYGMHIATAVQLGSFSPENGFQKFTWLPTMNQPVFLVPQEQVFEQVLSDSEFTVGKMPFTNCGLVIKQRELVEYHTAILGTTGTGKTELALEIIRQSLDRDTKVFCVDLTGEYRPRLSAYSPLDLSLPQTRVQALESALFAVETGTYGAPTEKAALKTFLDTVRPEITTQVDTFLQSDTERLGIFGLDEITNTKATLRVTELYLSAIMSWARRNRKAKRILIVLEEAHTIIPETYSSGFDSDTQWVVSRIGQIALQGRKYGVGLLIVSQRTALVSKTILSQCNTYFTHSLMDKTSLEYLGGVYSADYIKTIPNLQPREFIAHGVGIRSERPLLARVEFDPEKKRASDALNVQPAAEA